MEYLWTIFKTTIRFFNHMGPSGWMMTMLLVAAIGVLCLRGFGSRASH
jgi:hypothetical protein